MARLHELIHCSRHHTVWHLALRGIRVVSVRQCSFAIIALFTTCNANADWSGGIEAGAQLGSDDGPALRFFANNNSLPLSHFIFLDWIRDSGSGNFRIGYNPTYRISNSFYSFGRFDLEVDDPDGIDREINAVVGVGNNLFRRGNTRVKAEAGLGARQLTFDETEFTGTDDESDAFLFLSGTMSSSLLALLRFDARIIAKAGADQTTLDGELGFSVPIAPRTSLRYVYTVSQFNFDDRENITTEDTFFKVSYGF